MNALTEEERVAREREWLERRAEEDQRREAAQTFEKDLCQRLGIKHESGDLIIVRAEKKCRDIIEYLGLAPTDEDFKTGRLFWTKREDFMVASAFVSTKKGLIACVETVLDAQRLSSEFYRWISDKVYEHHKTAEDVALEEDFKRQRGERAARRAEWGKQNSELRAAEREELAARVKRTALPGPLVDELVCLAIKETNEQRESSPARKPTFAPPIPFANEIINALQRLRALDPKIEFEPGYGRLWAVWESPKKTHGKCQGFELRAGKERNGRLITNIRPGHGPKWWTGPKLTAPYLYLKEWFYAAEVAKREKLTRRKRNDSFLTRNFAN